METYAGFADGLAVSVALEGATSSSLIAVTAKEKRTDKELEVCPSDHDVKDDAMANPMTRIQKWVQHQRAGFTPGREALAPCSDTLANVIDDTVSSIVTPTWSIISMEEDDYSVRNDATLEQSMAELQAAMDATNFPTAFQNYEKKRAERRKVKNAGQIERRLEITPEPTASRTHASDQSFKIKPLRKESIVASEGTDQQNATFTLDRMEAEVNQTHQNLLVVPAEKVDTGESGQENGRLPAQQTHSLQPQPTTPNAHEERSKRK
ncbi:uncharacterized protein LOC110846471 isoform X2 [Folsomia candida]|uniref:uncharacterized protein LOC110846471 isoform X2 n=1 Tax=Folsomia candida TaxID=158441 RepID=UPI0016050EA4|nr:uncharacterized protein LOC110846471 isoform X2 [Folsomia candida]